MQTAIANANEIGVVYRRIGPALKQQLATPENSSRRLGRCRMGFQFLPREKSHFTAQAFSPAVPALTRPAMTLLDWVMPKHLSFPNRVFRLSKFRKAMGKFHQPAALGAFIPCIERVCGRKPLSWVQVETDRDKVGRSMMAQLGARLVRAGPAPKYG